MERSKKKAEKIELMQNLPDDMIVEVLSRLPAKSLYRFRCVCKSWSDLICPHFIRLNENRHNLFLLFEQHYSILDLHEATSDVVAANASMVKVESSIFKDYSPISSLLADARILTSCDGLLLSVLNKKMQKLFLFNPFSGEYKVIPPYGARFRHGQRGGQVFILNHPSPFSPLKLIRGQESDLVVLNWIVGIDWTVPVSLNGALHWSAWYKNEILCFDLKDEFKQVPGPPEEIFTGNFFSLDALKGNLCLGFWFELGYISGDGNEAIWSEGILDSSI
ncbi:unnamed protein product [Dovyalis caffra]|uniref:F-box domain-containing protein n=1 Tax=Dovyalis caffra TaxID=77055 RepID=A0AAV1RYP1_9ROSI|nr:unnamed protein product [Dovyalis caffra]